MERKKINQVVISGEGDILEVRKTVRNEAAALGFGPTDITRIVTAASELARNVFRFAGDGVMLCAQLSADGRIGLELVFEDQGPGIENIGQAMERGFTTGGGLGLGLPGAKRLVDQMDIVSAPGQGTRVTVVKWRGSKAA